MEPDIWIKPRMVLERRRGTGWMFWPLNVLYLFILTASWTSAFHVCSSFLMSLQEKRTLAYWAAVCKAMQECRVRMGWRVFSLKAFFHGDYVRVPLTHDITPNTTGQLTNAKPTHARSVHISTGKKPAAWLAWHTCWCDGFEDYLDSNVDWQRVQVHSF